MSNRRTFSALLPAAVAAGAAWLGTAALDAQSVHRAQAAITAGPNVHVSRSFATLIHNENLAIGDPTHPGRMISCSMVYPKDPGKLAMQYCYVTFDGGKTWDPTLKIAEGRVNGDPTAVYGAGDDVYVVALVIKDLDKPKDPDPDAPRDEARTVVYKSADGGKTWAEASRFQFIDREFILRDATGGKYNGRLYVLGQGSVRGIGGREDRRAYSLQMFRSLDNGKSFNGPVHAAYPDGTIINGVGTGAVLSDGTIVMLFGHTKKGRAQNLEEEPTVGPNAELHVISSADGGETFQKSSKITDWRVDRQRSEGGVLGQLVADAGSKPFKDRLYAVWPAIVTDRLQVQFAYSADKGKTWSKPAVINDDRSPEEKGKGPDHLLPSVAVNKDGVVLVTWYDRREAKDNLGWRLRGAASLNGGETFSSSVPIADSTNAYPQTTPWDLRSYASSDDKTSTVTIGVAIDSFYISGGHTTGLAADADGTFHPTWIDNRNGTAQLWSASVKVDGPVVKHGAAELADLEDVSQWVTFEMSNPTFDRATGKLSLTAQVKNQSKHTIETPVKVRVLTLEAGLGVPRITNADNGESGTGAVWDFTKLVAGGTLAPMKLSEPRTLTFQLSDVRGIKPGKNFEYRLMNIDARVFSKLRKAEDDKKKATDQ